MAIYDLTQYIPSSIETGDILNCPYIGRCISIKLPKGKYQFECWGAEGRTYTTAETGKGGYSIGKLTIVGSLLFHLYAGGKPIDDVSEGWNGGTATIDRGSGGGGGSDIRIANDSLYARVIVAGGGGGAGINTKGGHGGGLNGIAGQSGDFAGGGGGAQTYGGTCYNSSGSGKFGKGGYMNTNGGGAGGGWYGGGHGYSGSIVDSAGGGGSGYVYTADTASNYPAGCLLNPSFYLNETQILGGDQSFIDPETGSTTIGRSGNGYVRITVIEAHKDIEILVKKSGNWKKCLLYEKQNEIWNSELEEIRSSFAKYQFYIPTISYNLIYSGSYQSPTLRNYLSKYQSISGQISEINAGTYNLNINLLKQSYKWIDQTKTAKSLQWVIQKNPNGFTLDKESGFVSPQNNLIININNLSQSNIIVTNNNPEYCNYSLNNNQLIINYISNGKATLNINSSETSNYLATNKTISITCLNISAIKLDQFALPASAKSLTFIVGE